MLPESHQALLLPQVLVVVAMRGLLVLVLLVALAVPVVMVELVLVTGDGRRRVGGVVGWLSAAPPNRLAALINWTCEYGQRAGWGEEGV